MNNVLIKKTSSAKIIINNIKHNKYFKVLLYLLYILISKFVKKYSNHIRGINIIPLIKILNSNKLPIIIPKFSY